MHYEHSSNAYLSRSLLMCCWPYCSHRCYAIDCRIVGLHLYVGRNCFAHRFCYKYLCGPNQTWCRADYSNLLTYKVVSNHLQHIKFEDALKSYI